MQGEAYVKRLLHAFYAEYGVLFLLEHNNFRGVKIVARPVTRV